MQCMDFIKQIDAWIDLELSPDKARELKEHMAQCRSCSDKAARHRQLVEMLNHMPRIPAPANLARKTINAFRQNIPKQTFPEWWQSLTPWMRSAACGIVMAGIILGIVLCTHVSSFEDSTANLYAQTLIQTEGILP